MSETSSILNQILESGLFEAPLINLNENLSMDQVLDLVLKATNQAILKNPTVRQELDRYGRTLNEEGSESR